MLVIKLVPIVVTLEGIVKVTNLVEEKAKLPRVVTVLGKLMDSRLVRRNASLPIVNKPDDKVTAFKLVASTNV